MALLKAWRGDRQGNLQYRLAGLNFNPVMATAADLVIAEVEEIVEAGVIPPESGRHARGCTSTAWCSATPIPVRWDG